MYDSGMPSLLAEFVNASVSIVVRHPTKDRVDSQETSSAIYQGLFSKIAPDTSTDQIQYGSVVDFCIVVPCGNAPKILEPRE